MKEIKKAIITTTINPPTRALKAFAEICVRDGWTMFIVGDQKTPHDAYAEFVEQYENAIVYIRPEDQEATPALKELSDLIGWNCIQRRNFGLIAAYKWGADIIATIDDDNIPTEDWGKVCRVGEEFGVSTFKSDLPVFDPIAPAFPTLWHRGFPVQLIHERKIDKPQLLRRKVLVQADLWDGDPDIDAICRISQRPTAIFNPAIIHYAGDKPMPFNSQNTFLSREVIPEYFLFPHVGRMDDIWAAYYVQAIFGDCVAFYKATVFQDRNDHNLVRDLENEMLGYNHTIDFIDWVFGESGPRDTRLKGLKFPEYFPEKAVQAFKVYQQIINGGDSK